MEPRPKLTREQRRWFHGSFCIDENGDPRRLFHSTSADADFGEFAPLSHFGTLQAAESRGRNLNHDFIVHEVLLNIRKPLVIEDSGRDSIFTIPDVVNSMPEDFWEDLASAEVDILLEGDDEEALPLFIGYLSDFGYDGLLYANTIEGGTSYCVFRPEQVWVIGAEEPGIIPRRVQSRSLDR
jgi:hypothetical protein